MRTTLASIITTEADPNKKRHDVVIKLVKLANYQINLRSFHPNTQFVQTGNEAEKLELKYSSDEEINHQWKEE